MIRQKEIEFLLEKYSNTLSSFWKREREFIKKNIEKKGKSFKYFEEPLYNMFSIFSNKNKLLKKIKKDLLFSKLKKIKKKKSFLLTPGNIPLLEIQYLYFLILVSEEILWRPSRNFMELSNKLLDYLKKNNFKNIKIVNEDLENLKEKIKDFDYFVLIGSDRTIKEFKKNIDKSKKIIEYGSKTSVSIITDKVKIKEFIKDITYFSHSGCLSPTIIFVHKNIFNEFLEKLKKELLKIKGLFSEREKLFNFYIHLSEEEKIEKIGEFYIKLNPENIFISKGFINIFEFSDFENLVKKIKNIENFIQGMSIHPFKKEILKILKENFKNVYIKKIGKLQIIDENFFADGIKPLSLLFD
ncbi:MAG: aldehyde dehydrogenase family protein [candidate division WOR-3 bacterium]